VLIGLSKRHLREGTLPAGTVIPVAKALYLCDGHIAFPNRKTDLMGIITSIRPASYPHVQKHFVIYAQLISGLGQVPFYFDVRLAASGQLIRTTNIHTLNFPRRDKLVELALTMQGCPFSQRGMYLIELHCNGQWVADTSLELL
jgi:hypothetical protein